MAEPFFRLARRLRPDLNSLSGQRRLSGVADVVSLLFSLPLLVVALVWLVRVSDWRVVGQQWPLVLLLGALIILFNRFSFYIITEIRSGGYANSQGALDGMVMWTALLIMGPVAIWLDVLWNLGNFIYNWRTTRTISSAWSRARALITSTASNALALLVGWRAYLILGGEIPMRGLVIGQILPAMVGMLVQFLVVILVHGGYIGYVVWALRNVMHTPTSRAVNFFVLAMALPALANPFGILAAGLYLEDGVSLFLFDMIGLLL
ncbi:MAG TPA: hypothetical protein VLM83_11445, partial [Anaerolineales bacterium]|nr:hypothetical protein [Anaerolineales bacterium]